MSYMLLIVEPVEQRSERGEAAGRDLYAQMLRFADDLKARGKLRAAESLTSQNEAVRVQVRNDQPKLIDGPFAEAKEMIGGFYLLNCDSREEALEIAQACPAAGWCTVEVRKLGPCFM
ncbi:dehydrogenase [Burkholderia sp. SRS-W-2-2016]|uniref:YciI family protein n=1 Tax=Burkholderia sp. SRS-W-2-2016 TaxID=1926878 RepID=UPI00094B4CDF|nr:YciI family protein [Burkholderia sp. SRS-W-2-2016]OLL31842.1 dehydrogenase [Burkholderia sp. SRS-W-2-2016]